MGGVDAAVIHPPGWDPDSTEMAFKAVRNCPGRFAILVFSIGILEVAARAFSQPQRSRGWPSPLSACRLSAPLLRSSASALEGC
jgi:hypothetical protein